MSLPWLRLRFSLRMLMLATGLLAVFAAYFKIAYIDRYRQEDRLVQRLGQLGAVAYTVRREPTWLWSWFGDGASRKVISITITGSRIGDAELAEIGTLTDLYGLRCENNCTGITDTGVESVARLSGMVELGLRGTPITRLPPLKGLKKLVDLDVAFTNVAEIDLPSLPALTSLNLRGTRLSDEMLASLPALPSLETLDIGAISQVGIGVTGVGLSCLTRKKFPKLVRIYLYSAHVSESEIDRLKQVFPGLTVYH